MVKNSFKTILLKKIEDSNKVKLKLLSNFDKIEKIALIMINTLKKGNKLILCSKNRGFSKIHTISIQKI